MFELPQGEESFLAQFMFFECDSEEYYETTTHLSRRNAKEVTGNFKTTSQTNKSLSEFGSTQKGCKLIFFYQKPTFYRF